MTVKDELTLLTKGYSRAEIKEMKEREKIENGECQDEPEKKDEPENVSRETLEKDNRIKELETQLEKAQEENIHRDNSGDIDTRSDFDKCVDIFKGSF